MEKWCGSMWSVDGVSIPLFCKSFVLNVKFLVMQKCANGDIFCVRMNVVCGHKKFIHIQKVVSIRSRSNLWKNRDVRKGLDGVRKRQYQSLFLCHFAPAEELFEMPYHFLLSPGTGTTLLSILYGFRRDRESLGPRQPYGKRARLD
jgi:hypothetical protein